MARKITKLMLAAAMGFGLLSLTPKKAEPQQPVVQEQVSYGGIPSEALIESLLGRKLVLDENNYGLDFGGLDIGVKKSPVFEKSLLEKPIATGVAEEKEYKVKAGDTQFGYKTLVQSDVRDNFSDLELFLIEQKFSLEQRLGAKPSMLPELGESKLLQEEFYFESGSTKLSALKTQDDIFYSASIGEKLQYEENSQLSKLRISNIGAEASWEQGMIGSPKFNLPNVAGRQLAFNFNNNTYSERIERGIGEQREIKIPEAVELSLSRGKLSQNPQTKEYIEGKDLHVVLFPETEDSLKFQESIIAGTTTRSLSANNINLAQIKTGTSEKYGLNIGDFLTNYYHDESGITEFDVTNQGQMFRTRLAADSKILQYKGEQENIELIMHDLYTKVIADFPIQGKPATIGFGDDLIKVSYKGENISALYHAEDGNKVIALLTEKATFEQNREKRTEKLTIPELGIVYDKTPDAVHYSVPVLGLDAVITGQGQRYSFEKDGTNIAVQNLESGDIYSFKTRGFPAEIAVNENSDITIDYKGENMALLYSDDKIQRIELKEEVGDVALELTKPEKGEQTATVTLTPDPLALSITALTPHLGTFYPIALAINLNAGGFTASHTYTRDKDEITRLGYNLEKVLESGKETHIGLRAEARNGNWVVGYFLLGKRF